MRDLEELLENQRETINKIPMSHQQKTCRSGINNSAQSVSNSF